MRSVDKFPDMKLHYQREEGGTEDATDEDTSVSRVDVELVSDPGLLEALCINLRASVKDLRQVIKHLPQCHVTGILALKPCFSFRGRTSPFRGRPCLRFIGF